MKRQTVTLYRKRESQPFKWFLAAIVFILGLTVTFSELFGVAITEGM